MQETGFVAPLFSQRLMPSSAYRVSIPKSIFFFLMLSSAIFLFIPNGIYIVACIFVIVCILLLLWKYHIPGILVFSFLMQWLQVVAFVVWINVRGWKIDDPVKSGPYALISSLLGLLLMGLIIHFIVKPLPVYNNRQFVKEASSINEKKVLYLYIFSTVFLSSIGFIFGNTSGLAQILVTIADFKWVFFIWYGCIAWINKKNRLIILIILVYEFVTGLYSYFSSFKDVLFYAVIVSLTFIKSVSFKQFLRLLFMVVLLAGLFVMWTAIKGEYRTYLSGGKRQQVVTVTRSEALDQLGKKVKTLELEDFQMALNMSLYRVQYLYHMALAMDRVPAIMPHEEGGLWWENISFVFTPRILFPDKPIYEATSKTRKYTGLRLAGYKQGASFSLCYFADSYVDFGYFGMYVPIAFMALFVSFIYRTFYRMSQLNLFLRFAIINVVLYNFASFEADGLYLFGRLITSFLVFWVLGRVFFPMVQKWLNK